MSGQRLWAPWRMRYVQGGRKDEGYIFCLAAAASDDEARLVLHRAERCLVMLNAFLYNSGHLMVSPLRHAASIEDLDDDELLELMTLTRRALRAVRKTYGPDGFNLGVNEGEIAGAGFAVMCTCTSSRAGRRTGRHARAAPVPGGLLRAAARAVHLSPPPGSGVVLSLRWWGARRTGRSTSR